MKRRPAGWRDLALTGRTLALVASAENIGVIDHGCNEGSGNPLASAAERSPQGMRPVCQNGSSNPDSSFRTVAWLWPPNIQSLQASTAQAESQI
jgi:hypothetical protein